MKLRQKDLHRLEVIASRTPMLKRMEGDMVGFHGECPLCGNHTLKVILQNTDRNIEIICLKGCPPMEILDAMKVDHWIRYEDWKPAKPHRGRLPKEAVKASSTAVIPRPENLPNTLEGLQEFILIEGARLEAYRAALKKVNRLNIAQDVWLKTLANAQTVARALLFAEMKLGDLLKAIPDKAASSARGTRSLPSGITKKQSYEAQLLSDHANIVELTIVEAEQHQDIASRRAVLRAIDRARKSVEKPERAEVDDVEAGSSKDAKKRLMKCLDLLQEPFPADLNDDDREVLRELARCIARRLAVLFPELTSPSGETDHMRMEIILEKNGAGCYEAATGE